LSGWLRAVALALLLMLASWAALVVLARRLPPGLLRDLAGILPACVTTARQVPREVLLEAWPGDPRLLERLLGRARSARGPA
jgi:hypothetical protein